MNAVPRTKSIAYQTPPLFPDLPAPIKRVQSDISGLVIGPNSAVRRLIVQFRDGLEEASACMSEAKRHDTLHDAYALNIERLALGGIRYSTDNGCPCKARFQAIYRDDKGLMAADDREDERIYGGAWGWIKRLLGCIARTLAEGRPAPTGAGEAGAEMKEPWEVAWKQHKDAAAEAVHVRWMQAKISHGFADHPWTSAGYGDERYCTACAAQGGFPKGASRHHSDMIPFADLSDEIKAYDYETAIIGFKFGYEAGCQARDDRDLDPESTGPWPQ